MTRRKKKNTDRFYVTAPLTSQDLPLETLKQLIEENIIHDELPFKLLAAQYPSLLDEWYPGYPGFPREMTADDPFCLLGCIKNGILTFSDMPTCENTPFSLEIVLSWKENTRYGFKKRIILGSLTS